MFSLTKIQVIKELYHPKFILVRDQRQAIQRMMYHLLVSLVKGKQKTGRDTYTSVLTLLVHSPGNIHLHMHMHSS